MNSGQNTTSNKTIRRDLANNETATFCPLALSGILHPTLCVRVAILQTVLDNLFGVRHTFVYINYFYHLIKYIKDTILFVLSCFV